MARYRVILQAEMLERVTIEASREIEAESAEAAEDIAGKSGFAEDLEWYEIDRTEEDDGYHVERVEACEAGMEVVTR